MSGIGIILNPYSGSYRQDPKRLGRVGFIVGDNATCHATDTLDQVCQLAHEFKERDIDILGIAGGDGTYCRTLTTFIKVYGEKPLPRVAFLRGGTMNNTANHLRIRGAPERLITNLILKYHKGEAFEETNINMIKVNEGYGFVFGVGMIERFVNTYQQVDNPTPARGLRLLVQAIITAIFNAGFGRILCERFDCGLSIDGWPAPFKNYTAAVAGTCRSLGFKFRPLYRATSEPGRFQVVAASTTSRQMASTFPRMVLARPTRSEHFIDKMANQVVFEFDRPMPYVIDGEIMGPADRIEITTGPLLTCIVS